MKQKKISIVLSLYNEEKGIRLFKDELFDAIEMIDDCFFELIWVNDGSVDGTQLEIDKIRAEKGKNWTNISIEFSRNFGHEAAMIAGVDKASGEAVICMDADGQHPPTILKDMIHSFYKGNEVILMQRQSRADGASVKKLFSSVFYKLLNSLSTIRLQENSSDFFLISQKVADVLRKDFRENNRFIRGFIQSVGFNRDTLLFDAPERLRGKSNYNFKSLFKLAINAIFSFSSKPLRFTIIASLIFVFLTLILTVYSVYNYFVEDELPAGYTTIVIFMSFAFSILFIIITILSMYFEKALQEIRKRPIYIIKSIKGE